MVAISLREKGMILRSGHAPGADLAFENGAYGKAEIYLPWPAFNAATHIQGMTIYSPSEEALTIASNYHPAWSSLKHSSRSLMACNVHQVLGASCDSPAKAVICWTPDGSLDGSSSKSGGTGQALRIAKAYAIPVFNLARAEHKAWAEFISEYSGPL